jgi:malonyl-CoA O-methyltransferase
LSVPDRRAARRGFTRAAQLAQEDVLAREASRRMASRLDYVRITPAHVLDAGCARGQDLSVLRERYPAAEVIGLDWSEALLRDASGRRTLLDRARGLFGAATPRLVCGDMDRMPFGDGVFGLIWSNLALGWSDDPIAGLRELQRVMAPGGLLMFCSYGPDTLRELRGAFASVDTQPHVHAFIDMHDVGDMLAASGFSAPVMDMEIITLTYADVESLVRDLRTSGQTNAAQDRRRGMTGRELWRRMEAAYETERRDGRIPATVEIVYGHAWKAEPRRTDGRAPIRFESRVRR